MPAQLQTQAHHLQHVEHWSVHSGDTTGVPRLPMGILDKPRAAFALLILIVVTLVLIPLQWLSVRFDLPLKRRIPVCFHRLALSMLGIRVRIFGAPLKNRPLLVLSNHVSWTDIVVLGAQMPLCFVAKSEMANWGIFGLFAKLQRTIFVERARRAKTAEQSEVMAARLTEGDPIVLFPEGTTGDGNRVLPFKSALVGAAEALARNGEQPVIIQPCTLAFTGYAGLPAGRYFRSRLDWLGDYDLIEHIKAILMLGNAEIEVHWGTPIILNGATDRKTATRRAEAEIRQTLYEANRGTLSVR